MVGINSKSFYLSALLSALLTVLLSQSKGDVEAERIDPVHAMRMPQAPLEPHGRHHNEDHAAAGPVDPDPPFSSNHLRIPVSALALPAARPQDHRAARGS